MKKHLGFLALAGGLILAGCGEKKSPPPQPNPAPATQTEKPADEAQSPTASKSTGSGNPITAPVDYLAAVGKAQQLAVKKIDTAALSNAIQLFNAQEGRYPKDLNELVSTHYMNQLPQPPYGMKLDYDATEGKVSVVKK